MSKTARIFVSYSHADEAHRVRLETHLAPLRREGMVEAWHDGRIAPGAEWSEEIQQQLSASDIILLLVSPDFIASEYCFERELRLALKRHESGLARVIPIFVRHTDVEHLPLARLQGLPRNAKPVTAWGDADEAWTDVAKGIRKAISMLPNDHDAQGNTKASKAHIGSGQHLKFGTIAPACFSVGSPTVDPRLFFGRQREVRRLSWMLGRVPMQNVAIIGPKRSGKTSLLLHMQHLLSASSEDCAPLPNRNCIYVDFQDARLSREEGLLCHLRDALGFDACGPCNLESFLELVGTGLPKPSIVLFDEIGAAMSPQARLEDRLFESFRSLCNRLAGQLAFIIASHRHPQELASNRGLSSPFFNIFGYAARLGPFTDEEARALLASSPIPFSQDDVNWMLCQSGLWPVLLQVLARERLMTLEEQESGDGWREAALSQMKPFRHLLEEVA